MQLFMVHLYYISRDNCITYMYHVLLLSFIVFKDFRIIWRHKTSFWLHDTAPDLHGVTDSLSILLNAHENNYPPYYHDK